MEPFARVRAVADAMAGFRPPWWVAGGWAIDLFLDRQTRDHEDIEIAILRGDQMSLQEFLHGWTLRRIVQDMHTPAPWVPGERIDAPDHEVHAASADGSLTFEILLNEGERDTWRYRRNPAVARPLALLGMRSADGVPFFAPEVVLLYKAKGPRPCDFQDFRVARGAMDPEPRAWLRSALQMCHPGHPWIAQL